MADFIDGLIKFVYLAIVILLFRKIRVAWKQRKHRKLNEPLDLREELNHLWRALSRDELRLNKNFNDPGTTYFNGNVVQYCSYRQKGSDEIVKIKLRGTEGAFSITYEEEEPKELEDPRGTSRKIQTKEERDSLYWALPQILAFMQNSVLTVANGASE